MYNSLKVYTHVHVCISSKITMEKQYTEQQTNPSSFYIKW